jgi:O-antigen/teichoic acid export membrane protein
MAGASLAPRLLASYVGQTYVTLIGVVISPLYVRYLGVEGYGLVGIFTLMQSWLALLDFGFSATLAREAARYGAGKRTATEFRQLVTLLGRVFLASGVLIAAAGVAASPWISRHWLKLTVMSPGDATLSLAAMTLALALRWRTEPYRSILIGFERQVWLNGFNSLAATVRYLGAAALLAFAGWSIVGFFLYQLLVAALETAILLFVTHRLLPRERGAESAGARLSWPELRPMMKFALSVAFVSMVWLFLSQYDKLLLSTLLPLRSYGVFALATVAAGGVSLLGAPVGQVIMPRLASLAAQGGDTEMRGLYRRATALVSAMVAPASLMLALYGQQVLWVWTGDTRLASEAYPILRWYALGNGLLAITTFAYFLQYAHGDLTLHIRGNVVFAVVLIPAITVAALRYGAVGAGVTWFVANLIYLLGWTFLVHWRFAPGLHWRWLGRDVAVVAAPGVAVLVVMRMVAWPWYAERVVDFLALAVLGLAALAASALCIPGFVTSAVAWIQGRRA